MKVKVIFVRTALLTVVVVYSSIFWVDLLAAGVVREVLGVQDVLDKASHWLHMWFALRIVLDLHVQGLAPF